MGANSRTTGPSFRFVALLLVEHEHVYYDFGFERIPFQPGFGPETFGRAPHHSVHGERRIAPGTSRCLCKDVSPDKGKLHLRITHSIVCTAASSSNDVPCYLGHSRTPTDPSRIHLKPSRRRSMRIVSKASCVMPFTPASAIGPF